MALLPEVGLNCLTCVMVSASQWWMDGCQHDSVTYSPSCFSLSGGVLFTLSLVFLIPHLLRVPLPSVVPYLCFPVLVSLSASLHFSYFSPFAFLPLVCAVDCLPEQHVAGGERKKQPWRRKKAHWQKLLPPSLLVAAKKYINYLNDWMMLAQLWGCCLCRDEWRSSAQCRFLCRLVFVLRVQPRHQ